MPCSPSPKANWLKPPSLLFSLSLSLSLSLRALHFALGVGSSLYLAFSSKPPQAHIRISPPLSLSTQTKRAPHEVSSLTLPAFFSSSPPLQKEKEAVLLALRPTSSVNTPLKKMEKNMNLTAGRTRKRKASEEVQPFLHSLDELNQDLLEKILSWLPASSFFRLRSVCKRWSSVVPSTTFRIACSQVPFRDPWFLMVDQDLDHSVILDTSEGNWRNLNKPISFNKSNQASWIAVASSGGLVCFRCTTGEFMACNPLTGASRELPPARETQPLLAISMSSSPKNSSSYRIVLVTGELPNLHYRVFHSDKNQWEDDLMLIKKAESSPETDSAGGDTLYFLDKSGDVVATNMQRNPSRQFLAVMSIKDSEEIVYFLSHSGSIVACNITRRTFHEYPRLLPVCSEYSIDVVLCKKEMMVVLLSEFFETASLRLWTFSEADRAWKQVAAMPPAMSHEFYGKKADINCVGCGDTIFVCLNSNEFSRYVIYNVVTNGWLELPKCFVNGKAKDFMSAFSFEPRLEVSV